MKKFENKVAFITGGGSGIGLSSAQLLAEQGAKVMIVDYDEKHGQAAADSINKAGGTAAFIKCNVASAAECKNAVTETVKRFGRLDIAFNNAGIGGEQATIDGYKEDVWQKVIDINLSGVWYCMKYQLQEMLKNKSGVIVNMASILGHVGFAMASAYVAAKHGVVGMTKTAALEYGTSGIRINSICPGFIITPLLENAGMTEDSEAGKMIAGLHAMKRMGKPEEVAKAFMFLASDDSSFVTGASLLVDGGYTAQ